MTSLPLPARTDILKRSAMLVKSDIPQSLGLFRILLRFLSAFVILNSTTYSTICQFGGDVLPITGWHLLRRWG